MLFPSLPKIYFQNVWIHNTYKQWWSLGSVHCKSGVINNTPMHLQKRNALPHIVRHHWLPPKYNFQQFHHVLNSPNTKHSPGPASLKIFSFSLFYIIECSGVLDCWSDKTKQGWWQKEYLYKKQFSWFVICVIRVIQTGKSLLYETTICPL